MCVIFLGLIDSANPSRVVGVVTGQYLCQWPADLQYRTDGGMGDGTGLNNDTDACTYY